MFTELYKGYSMKYLEVKDDGSVWGPAGRYFDPSTDTTKGLTCGAATLLLGVYTGTSPAVIDVQTQDFMAFL
eukprot:SAG22_NODE_13_length_33548_cov_57.167773_10_plen_72_part_00